MFLPPLAPEIRESAPPPVASRNPQIMANRAIDAYKRFKEERLLSLVS